MIKDMVKHENMSFTTSDAVSHPEPTRMSYVVFWHRDTMKMRLLNMYLLFVFVDVIGLTVVSYGVIQSFQQTTIIAKYKWLSVFMIQTTIWNTTDRTKHEPSFLVPHNLSITNNTTYHFQNHTHWNVEHQNHVLHALGMVTEHNQKLDHTVCRLVVIIMTCIHRNRVNIFVVIGFCTVLFSTTYLLCGAQRCISVLTQHKTRAEAKGPPPNLSFVSVQSTRIRHRASSLAGCMSVDNDILFFYQADENWIVNTNTPSTSPCEYIRHNV